MQTDIQANETEYKGQKQHLKSVRGRAFKNTWCYDNELSNLEKN